MKELTWREAIFCASLALIIAIFVANDSVSIFLVVWFYPISGVLDHI